MLADTNTMGAIQITAADNAESEKENPPEETRPFEHTSEGEDSKLDVDRQNIEKKEYIDNEAKEKKGVRKRLNPLYYLWRAMRDSNARPLVPETNALSN